MIRTAMNKLLSMHKVGMHRFSSSRTLISWEPKYGGIFMKFPIDRLGLNMLLFTHSQMKFKHLAIAMNLQDEHIKYPAGVDSETIIAEFLNDWNNPRSVEVVYEGRRKLIKNKACQKDVKKVLNIVKNPQSIYGHLFRYLNANPQSKRQSGDINYFLNHFYLRLTAQTYCLINKIGLNSKMTPELTSQILNYIGSEYDNRSPAQIKQVVTGINLVKSKIEATKQEIKTIEDEGDRVIKLYKYGAIVVTFVHIFGFFIMIFYIDWLGWDITEPLTYTVGVLYTLLGIRFYRKFKTDRNSENIREVLFKATMKPKKLIQLKQFRHRLNLHERQAHRLEAKVRILKNRINFRTSLCQALTSQKPQ